MGRWQSDVLRSFVVGQWRKSRINGFAQSFDGANTEYFEGEFQMGRKHGYGVETKLDDRGAATDQYRGMFEKGLRNGRGVLESFGHYRLEADFLQGFIHGPGRMEFTDGDRFEGNFHLDQRNGLGVYTFQNGDSSS